MSTTSKVLQVAEDFLFVRESPPGSNAGRWVEAMQRVCNGAKGQPWCAAYVGTVLGIAFQGKPPLPYTMGCDELLEAGRKAGWLRDTPQPGDVFLRLKTPTDADHTGFVSSVDGNTFGTLEGNTTGGTGSREGIGAFADTRTMAPGRYVFVRYPRGDR